MKANKIHLREMRTLQDGKGAGVTAASGLVKAGSHFYVIADDQVSLAAFNFEQGTDINFVPLLQKVLPSDFKERKKQKPDWESLIQLKLRADQAILLAVPSGSTANRMTGAYVVLDESGHIQNQNSRVVDFSKLYAKLSEAFAELNIEGVCVLNEKLKLLQRGNGASGKNAIIDIDLKSFLADLESEVPLRAENIAKISEYDLGNLNGKKLDFTDACVLNEKLWFLAVAEDSSSTYEDGKYGGAIIGCIDSSGNEIARYEIDCSTKPEGLWVEAEERRLCFYVVTDADNEKVFASLYFGKLL